MTTLGRAAKSVSVMLGGLLLGLAVARCGAEGTPLPERASDTAKASGCKSLQGYMPNFFAMMRDPAQPLAGLAAVVTDLTTGTGAKTAGDPIARVLNATIKGLKSYTEDPFEVPNLSALSGRFAAPLRNHLSSLKGTPRQSGLQSGRAAVVVVRSPL